MMALGAAFALVVGCGEDAADAPPAEFMPRPARVFQVSDLDIGQRSFVYGEEMQIVFDRDPGVVELDYGGAAPLAPVAGENTTRAFLLERSPTVLTWDNGGSLVLEYDPIVERNPPVPELVDAWPPFGSRGISDVNLNQRTPIWLKFGVQARRRGGIIPRLRVDEAEITGPDGIAWIPETSVGVDFVALLSDDAHTYERGQTYGVHVEVTFAIAPNSPRAYDYEFKVHPTKP
jgi:hypothetical protein